MTRRAVKFGATEHVAAMARRASGNRLFLLHQVAVGARLLVEGPVALDVALQAENALAKEANTGAERGPVALSTGELTVGVRLQVARHAPVARDAKRRIGGDVLLNLARATARQGRERDQQKVQSEATTPNRAPFWGARIAGWFRLLLWLHVVTPLLI